jgi:soluble lytic murein transglycosylase-like protein
MNAKAIPTPTMVLPTPVAETPRTFNRLSRYWPDDILALEGIIAVAADMNGLDPNLLAALIKKESWFNPANFPQGLRRCPEGPCSGSCTSTEGALGPAQVMPYHFGTHEDGRDLVTNIRRGAKILRGYIDKKGGTRKGLAAYYCGPNNVTYWQECWAYADSILGWHEQSLGSVGNQSH